MKKRVISLLLALLTVVLMLPVMAVGVSAEAAISINKAGTTYTLFASGRTGSAQEYSYNKNPAPGTLTNNGYDLYASYSNLRTIVVGRSFKIDTPVTERSELSIRAFDVDESSGEVDRIRLVDETSGTKKVIGDLAGQDWKWNDTTLYIDPSYFTVGHTYHLENTEEVSGWVVWIRSVYLKIGGTPDTKAGIENAAITASASSSGQISGALTIKSYQNASYSVEIRAIETATGYQRAGIQTTYSGSTAGTTSFFSMSLESGSPSGTYYVSAVIKDQSTGAVLYTTPSATVVYSPVVRYTVSYNPNGGSTNVPMDSGSYQKGETVNVKFDYIPSRTGYTFLGWSENAGASTPTFTSGGKRTFTMGTSNVVLYAIWKKAECQHSRWTVISRTEATCTECGREVLSCSECGKTRTNILPALHHDIASYVEREVSCTQDGVIVDRCQRAGCSYEKRTVTHGEHSFVLDHTKAPGCTEEGYTLYICSKCGAENREVLTSSHDYVESARVEATVGNAGKLTYTCTKCGDSYDVELPALKPVEKNASVLLIQDNLPWADDVNTRLLKDLMARGTVASFNIIRSSALDTFDLTQYGVVMIANDQTTAMYSRLSVNNTKLENYVRAGGTLIYGACDEGWGGCGSLTAALPGGVMTGNYYSVHNYIVDALHPIVTGVKTDGRSLRDELLKGNYCSHTYFDRTTLPAGTNIILRDANGNPTLVEYTLGDGTVIASGLTWEYFYVRNHFGMSTNYSKYAFDDMITYAVGADRAQTCAHDFDAGTVKAPSCTENGYTSYVCRACGYEYRDNIVGTVAHAWDAGTVTKEPGCTETGEMLFHCKGCAETKTEKIAASGHEWVLTTEVPAGCLVDEGQLTYKCKKCTAYAILLSDKPQPTNATVTLGQVSGKAGDTVVLPVRLSDAPDISVISVSDITYDTSKMKLTKVEWVCKAQLTGWDSTTGRGVASFGGNDRVDGAILNLTFTLNADTEDGALPVSCDIRARRILPSGSETDVDLTIIPGSVRVFGGLRGDADGDGKLTVSDAVYLLYNIMFGDTKYPLAQAADFDGDGQVNSSDAIYLLYNIMLGDKKYPLH